MKKGNINEITTLIISCLNESNMNTPVKEIYDYIILHKSFEFSETDSVITFGQHSWCHYTRRLLSYLVKEGRIHRMGYGKYIIPKVELS